MPCHALPARPASSAPLRPRRSACLPALQPCTDPFRFSTPCAGPGVTPAAGSPLGIYTLEGARVPPKGGDTLAHAARSPSPCPDPSAGHSAGPGIPHCVRLLLTGGGGGAQMDKQWQRGPRCFSSLGARGNPHSLSFPNVRGRAPCPMRLSSSLSRAKRARKGRRQWAGSGGREGRRVFTSCMNLRQTGRISLLKVALNIMTCFSWGVMRKISWTSRRMSTKKKEKKI